MTIPCSVMWRKYPFGIPAFGVVLHTSECMPEEAVMCQAGTVCEPGPKGYKCGKTLPQAVECGGAQIILETGATGNYCYSMFSHDRKQANHPLYICHP